MFGTEFFIIELIEANYANFGGQLDQASTIG